MKRSQKALSVIVVLAVALPVFLLLGIAYGAVPISMADVVNTALNNLGFSLASTSDAFSQNQLIIESIRTPRVLLASLIGAALAVSGALMQGLFRNPLADPAIIGVSSGAAVGAALAILFESIWPAGYAHWATTIAAFLGGLAATWLVFKIGTSPYGTSVATMLLAGIAINAFAMAGIGLINYLADDNQLRSIIFWQMGSLGAASWLNVWSMAVVVAAVALVLPRYANTLNALLLGDSEARHLGVNVDKAKKWLIIVTAVLVGVAVAFAGMIGFVGLVVPHLIRLVIGPDHRFLLPASALLGATLMVLADLCARIVISPAELPIGIVTALIGAPFFMFLLLQKRQTISG
ncbi:FecCD family ABC transporter permease [Spartinivicinus ruber]|uniref:FecCD family ABC transporter permease n=1 Tax=Spartinivicinus ruber TaxID=2683272 RepID=UPI0013D36415|nr:iron chelate uptake ABC transporter family permease subunit [Spartinivicinus ruber]